MLDEKLPMAHRRTPGLACGDDPAGDKALDSGVEPTSPHRPWRRPNHAAGLGGPKTKDAPAPMRREPRWSQSERGPRAHETGTSMIPTRKRPPRKRSGDLSGSRAKKAPAPREGGSRKSDILLKTPPEPNLKKGGFGGV